MTGKLILPPYYTSVRGPLIFLGGPVQGTYDWQADAIEIIQKKTPEIHIASPRRMRIGDDFNYEDQVRWEGLYMEYGRVNGVNLFWLAKELYPIPGRAFAQTSRQEIAEQRAKHEQGEKNLVVGIEQGFSGSRYTKLKLEQDCPDVPIFSTLEETVEKAIEYALEKLRFS